MQLLPVVFIFDNFEAALVSNLDPEAAGRGRRPFPELIRILTGRESQARVIICSQTEWQGLPVAGCMACQVNPLSVSEGAEVLIRYIKQWHDVNRSDTEAFSREDALTVSENVGGIPLDLICAASGADPLTGTVAFRSAVKDVGGSLKRFVETQSPQSLTILRVLSLAHAGLKRRVLHRIVEIERKQLELMMRTEHKHRWERERRTLTEQDRKHKNNIPILGDIDAIIDAALRENPGVIGVVRNGRLKTADSVLTLTQRVRLFICEQWERSDSRIAERVHRRLARLAWLQAVATEPSQKNFSVVKQSFPEWSVADRPAGLRGYAALEPSAAVPTAAFVIPERAPKDEVVERLDRYLQCLRHCLASVTLRKKSSQPSCLADIPYLTPKDACIALAMDATAADVVRFAYDVIYLTCLEQNTVSVGSKNDRWYLSRTLGWNEIKMDILCRFFELGFSTVNINKLVNRPTLLPAHLPRLVQARILHSLGIAAYYTYQPHLAARAIEHGLSQFIQLGRNRDAAKLLKTRCDLMFLQGELSSAEELIRDQMCALAGWKPEDDIETLLEETACDEGRIEIVSTLLGRYAVCTMLRENSRRALPYFEKAERLKQRVVGSPEFVLEGNIGRRYTQALLRTPPKRDMVKDRVLDEIAALRQAGHRNNDLCLRLIDGASVFRICGQLEVAATHLEQAGTMLGVLGENITARFEYTLEQARLNMTVGSRMKLSEALSARPRELLLDLLSSARARKFRLFECDILLLLCEEGETPEAEKATYLETATRLIEECGYRFRENDLDLAYQPTGDKRALAILGI